MNENNRFLIEEIDFSDIKKIEDMHELLMKKFGFPDFYGKNIHALIDCLSSLRYPEDGMTSITLKKDETLLLIIKNISETSRDVIVDFIIAIEAVNQRNINIGSPVSVLLSLC